MEVRKIEKEYLYPLARRTQSSSPFNSNFCSLPFSAYSYMTQICEGITSKHYLSYVCNWWVLNLLSWVQEKYGWVKLVVWWLGVSKISSDYEILFGSFTPWVWLTLTIIPDSLKSIFRGMLL